MVTDPDFSLGSVETALSPQARFEEFLQARGKRVTRQPALPSASRGLFR